MGDKDYVPVVETIERKNRIAKIAFWENVAGELTMAATEYLNLNDYFDEIEHQLLVKSTPSIDIMQA